MNPDRWRQIETLYHSALEREPGERAAFLSSACDGDSQLQSEVESLLSQKESPVDEPVWKAVEELLGTESDAKLPAGVRLGPYEILDLLGEGGMGAVYRARDTRLDRIVAIKLLRRELTGRADARKRFRREAQAISSLNHPHVCSLYDIGDQDGIDYLVMEYVEGETLANRLSRARLPIDQALRYGKQIAEALAAAHRQGIIHRDLKSANIMVTPAGVKVLDFGMAKFEEPARAAATMTTSRAIMGTPAYMAPEQLEGKTCDARTDIYALGLVLREMVSGERAPAMPLQPAALDRVVSTCLAADPAERWQSAHDVRLALESVEEAPDPAPQRRPSPMVAWVIGAALSLCTIVLAALHFREEAVVAPAFRFTIDPPEGSSFDSFALSPDGRRLAFAATKEGSRQLWLRALDTSSLMVLPGTEQAYNPFWSPDSRSIAFFNLGKLAVVDVSTTGTAPRRILYAGDTHATARGAWGPNGVIVFNPATYGPLRRVSAVGGTATALMQDTRRGHHTFPAFLPDGRFLFDLLIGSEGTTIYAGALNDPGMQPVRSGASPVYLDFGRWAADVPGRQYADGAVFRPERSGGEGRTASAG
jgi:eukaryotic-like serine/threonine-protein kinase